MNFDFTFFETLVNPLVVAACLVVGYIIKKWIADVDNKFIPTILAVLGAVLGCVVTKDISVSSIVGGAFSGLASTGLHQMFTQLIENKNNNN